MPRRQRAGGSRSSLLPDGCRSRAAGATSGASGAGLSAPLSSRRPDFPCPASTETRPSPAAHHLDEPGDETTRTAHAAAASAPEPLAGRLDDVIARFRLSCASSPHCDRVWASRSGTSPTARTVCRRRREPAHRRRQPRQETLRRAADPRGRPATAADDARPAPGCHAAGAPPSRAPVRRDRRPSPDRHGAARVLLTAGCR